MRIRRRSRKTHRRFWQQGFTLVEMMVIVMVVGILAAIALPSFGSLLDSMKVNQTVTDLRTALQDTQRQAIRKNQACTVQVLNANSNSGNGKGNSGNGKGNSENKQLVQGNCLTSGSPELADNIGLATNLQSSSTSGSSGALELKFGTLGSAEFTIQTAVTAPATPRDPSGKVVAFAESNPQAQKKCVAISSTLGLTRIGTYTGGLSPKDITDSGVCTALDWKQQ